MLTDDDLTTELRAAFRDATGDLQYAGRVPSPRSRLAVGVPLAASAAVVATLAVVWANAPETADAPVATPPSDTSRGHYAPRLVRDTIEVAGFSFTYRHAEGEVDLYSDLETELPDDARPIGAPDGVRAWTGTDASSGDQGVWIEAPTRNEGRLFAVLSPTWTIEQLEQLWVDGIED